MQMQTENRERVDTRSLAALESVSRELSVSYRDMQKQVVALQLELAASRNVRMRELAEKERLLARLSSLVAVLPGGVLLVDIEDVIRDANPEGLELLGEPLLGECWSEVASRSRSSQGSPDSKGSQGSKGSRGESDAQYRPGERHLSISSRALEGTGEQVVLITDTTEQHELQQQLGRRQRLVALGEMAARLAHQIRTPLSAMSLYLARLSSEELSRDERARICEKLSDRLRHTEGLIESMLSFVRGRSPVFEIVRVRQVLDAVAAAVSPSLPESASLCMTPVDDTLLLRGACDDLVGALVNLVNNALEAGGGEIDVDVWAGATGPDWLQIRISDNGPGIPDEVLPRIFDPFFTTRAKGTGLGLAVAAMTASNHGGELRARNRRAGGAEFLMDLPLVDTAESAAPPASEEVCA